MGKLFCYTQGAKNGKTIKKNNVFINVFEKKNIHYTGSFGAARIEFFLSLMHTQFQFPRI